MIKNILKKDRPMHEPSLDVSFYIYSRTIYGQTACICHLLLEMS